MLKANGTVITVANIKGGVGKTTIAVNTAIQLSRSGHSVCLIDSDKQLSATVFTEFRQHALEGMTGYILSQLANTNEDTLFSTIKQSRDVYEFIIVDCHGGDNEEQRMALAASDIVLIPVKPRAMDVWAVTKMAQLLAKVRALKPDNNLKAFSFLSIADRTSDDNRGTAELLENAKGIKYIDSPIIMRKAWATSAGLGLGIMEYMDNKDASSYADSKAVNEFEKLYKHILAEIKIMV